MLVLNLLIFLHADGCPEEERALNVNFNVYVTWPESEISTDPVNTSCPCGTINATRFGHPNLTRICGGSYTYGANWEDVDKSGCDYNNNTYKLCSVTQVRRMMLLMVCFVYCK